MLRLFLWVLLTGMAVAWVLRYAAKVRANPAASLVGFEHDSTNVAAPDETLTTTQKWVLLITILAFGLMIFSVIPWASLFGSTTGAADDYTTHSVAGVTPY